MCSNLTQTRVKRSLVDTHKNWHCTAGFWEGHASIIPLRDFHFLASFSRILVQLGARVTKLIPEESGSLSDSIFSFQCRLGCSKIKAWGLNTCSDTGSSYHDLSIFSLLLTLVSPSITLPVSFCFPSYSLSSSDSPFLNFLKFFICLILSSSHPHPYYPSRSSNSPLLAFLLLLFLLILPFLPFVFSYSSRLSPVAYSSLLP